MLSLNVPGGIRLTTNLFQGFPYELVKLYFSESGRFVALADPQGGQISLFDFNVMSWHNEWQSTFVDTIAFSGDNLMALIIHNKVEIREVLSGKICAIFDWSPLESEVASVAFFTSGDRSLIIGSDRRIVTVESGNWSLCSVYTYNKQGQYVLLDIQRMSKNINFWCTDAAPAPEKYALHTFDADNRSKLSRFQLDLSDGYALSPDADFVLVHRYEQASIEKINIRGENSDKALVESNFRQLRFSPNGHYFSYGVAQPSNVPLEECDTVDIWTTRSLERVQRLDCILSWNILWSKLQGMQAIFSRISDPLLSSHDLILFADLLTGRTLGYTYSHHWGHGRTAHFSPNCDRA
jgi:hypothetical protein